MKCATEDCIGCEYAEEWDDGYVYCSIDKCAYEDDEEYVEENANCLTEAELEEIRSALQILNKFFGTP